MATLYEIDNQLRALLELDDGSYCDTESGELLTKEDVDALNLDLKTKIESCLLFALEKQREAEAIEEEINRLKAHKDKAESKHDWVLGYVADHIEAGTKFSTPKVSIKWTTSKKAEPLANWEKLTPAEYWKLPPPPEPVIDKAAIRKDLMAGNAVEGWTLNVTRNIKPV